MSCSGEKNEHVCVTYSFSLMSGVSGPFGGLLANGAVADLAAVTFTPVTAPSVTPRRDSVHPVGF